MTISAGLRKRVSDLERATGIGVRYGLIMLQTLIACASRHEDDVVALLVGPKDAKVRIDRLPGESLDDFEHRANPGAGWQSAGQPVYCERERFKHPEYG